MAAFAISEDDGAIVVDISVNGAPECAIVDLGANGAMLVNPEYVRKNNLEVTDTGAKIRSFGAQLNVEGKVFIEKVELMGASHASVPALAVSGRRYRGCNFFIGVELLRRYNLSFDVKNRRIFAAPNRFVSSPFTDAAAVSNPG
jgi:hypothetical protein